MRRLDRDRLGQRRAGRQAELPSDTDKVNTLTESMHKTPEEGFAEAGRTARCGVRRRQKTADVEA